MRSREGRRLAGVGSFDADALVQACIDALHESDPRGAIGEAVRRAVSEPALLRSAYPVPVDPDDDGVLHRTNDLMVCYAIFPRDFHTGIHDHTVEAVIGVWAGHEDNHLYERDGEVLRPQGVRRVEQGDVLMLDADAIHDVHTPRSTWSAALHVYLGDIVGLARNEWADTDCAPTALDGAEQERRWYEAAAATGLLR